MFSIFSLRNSWKVSSPEKEMFHRLLRQYAETPGGAWLNEIPWRKFTIKWCPAMRGGSILGAYIPWVGKCVYLQPSATAPVQGKDFWPELMAPTLAHELRHAWQFRKFSLLYLLCCLPGLREITLEKDAWRISREAEKYFKRFD